MPIIKYYNAKTDQVKTKFALVYFQPIVLRDFSHRTRYSYFELLFKFLNKVGVYTSATCLSKPTIRRLEAAVDLEQ